MFNSRIRGAVQSVSQIRLITQIWRRVTTLWTLTLSDLTDSVVFMIGQFHGFSKQLQEILNSGLKEEKKIF